MRVKVVTVMRWYVQDEGWTRITVNRMRLTEWRRELIPQVRWCAKCGYKNCSNVDHLSYGITQCYLPPDRGDSCAFTQACCRYSFIDPGRMKAWVDLGGWLYQDGYTKHWYLLSSQQTAIIVFVFTVVTSTQRQSHLN